jgi:hypothetical protein
LDQYNSKCKRETKEKAMTAIDITDTYWIGTGEYEAAVAIAAIEAEMDGDTDGAEQIRADYREALALAEI